jgi:hypothetical protein
VIDHYGTAVGPLLGAVDGTVLELGTNDGVADGTVLGATDNVGALLGATELVGSMLTVGNELG